jgi:hypothetical protein
MRLGQPAVAGPDQSDSSGFRNALRNDILQGRSTVKGLDNVLEKSLAEDHNASRDTVRVPDLFSSVQLSSIWQNIASQVSLVVICQ